MGQPWSRVPLTVLAALVASVKIIVTAWPDLVSISYVREAYPMLTHYRLFAMGPVAVYPSVCLLIFLE